MLRLLKIEITKLRYNKMAKVITIVYFSLICLTALIASYEFDFGGVHFRLADQGIFNFPYIWHFNSWIAAWLKIFFAIVIVSMVANEYRNRTLKQNLIDGLSKKEFIISKFLTVLLYAVISTVFLFIVTLILGLIFSDFNEFSIIFSDMQYLFGYFIKLLGFFSFCMFLGILVKRSAFALGALGVWWLFEGILFLIFSVIKSRSNLDLTQSVTQFFPLKAIFNINVEPFSKLGVIQSIAGQLNEDFSNDYGIHWYQVLIVLVWTFLFIYWSYVLIKKRDL